MKSNKDLVTFSEDFITLHHYKEPLIKVKNGEGFGYYGALSSSRDGNFVQCHICGKLFKDLGSHVRQKHRMPLSEYREKFQLAYTTSLISESERERRKNGTLEWLKNMSEEEKIKLRNKQRKGFLKYLKERGERIQPKIQLETRNKRGTCPEQLLEKIREAKEKLGHTPSKHDFIRYCGSQRYVHLIYKIHGSWKKAIEMCGYKISDKKGGSPKRYEDKELLEYLKIFYIENNKIPTITDFRKGLLPDYETYRKRFGSIYKAREMAGVPNIIKK